MVLILLALACFAVAVLAASNVYRSVAGGPPGQQGTLVLNQPGAVQVVWNLTYLEISFAGPTVGPNAKVTIYDGPIANSVVLFSVWLNGPQFGAVAGSSVGSVQKIDIPNDATGLPALQASAGNDMNIVVNGFGNNACIINARFTDGIPMGRT